MKKFTLFSFFLCLSFFAENILSNTHYSDSKLVELSSDSPIDILKDNNIDPSFLSLTPMAFPASLTVCSNADGTGTYNLPSVDNIVNGGSGYTVWWWEDAAATIPIANPGNYTSFPGSVWATVDDGVCQSAPVEVTLDVFPVINTSTMTFNPSATAGCTPLDVTITVNLPPGIYNIFGNLFTTSGSTPWQLATWFDGAAFMITFTESSYYVFDYVVDHVNGCTYTLPNPDTLFFDVYTEPDITILNNPIICEGESVDLAPLAFTTTNLPITFHSGLPATGANQLPTPIVSPTTTTTYYAYAGILPACSNTEPITVTVNTPAPVILGSAQVCDDDFGFNLLSLVDPLFPNGSWSGMGVSGNTFDPSGLSGLIPLTFTPDPGLCALPADTYIEVLPVSSPVLSTATMCENDPLLYLPDLADPLFPAGNWSGDGVSGDFFDPFGLSGIITLTFFPSDPCLLTATTQVTVNSLAIPILGNGEICENNGVFDLSQLLDPQYPTGLWSGIGVSGNTFDPSGLGGGSYSLVFISDQDCVGPSNVTITVNSLLAPSLLSDEICAGNGLYDLSGLQDPLFPNGTWTGPGVSNNEFDPVGQSGTVQLLFTPIDPCSEAATTSLSVHEIPTLDSVLETCSSDNLTYTVSFEINGGDPTTYTVNGTPSSSPFSSPPISSGSTYSFEVDDGNGCGPNMVSGIFNCGCLTFSGTMNLAGSPFVICSDDILTATFNGDAILGVDDLLLFILHDSSGTQLGNVFDINNEPVFGFPANGVLGETYYLSAVAGIEDGIGDINFNDGCLSVSAGVPVVFYEPTESIGNGGTVCEGECFDLEINFSGVSPFELVYEIATPNGIVEETYSILLENSSLSICARQIME